MQSAIVIAEEISKIDIRLKPKIYCSEVLKIICDKLGYNFGSIIVRNDMGKGKIFSAHNLPESYPELVSRATAPVLSSPSGIAIKDKRTVVVNDTRKEPRLKPWSDLLEVLNINTIVWVPLFSKGKAFGTYNLYDYRKRDVSEEEIVVLNHLSLLISVNIQSNEYIDQSQEKTVQLEEEITERKRIEEQLVLARDKAEAANKAKSEFLANISHEVKTPMNAIMGFTHILLDDANSDETLEMLEIIQQSGETLLMLFEDFLDVARIESGDMILNPVNFSLKSTLEHLRVIFAAKAKEKNLDFFVSTNASIPSTVHGDSQRTHQVILHIVRNAFKFTHKGSVSIHCDYEHRQQKAIITVSDTGIGISDEKKELIFSAFQQVDGSPTRRYQGAGLGLTISGKVAELMGGRITLDSTPGTGSIFTIELPLPPA
jgi:signal transduction histidine kinase